MFTDYLERYFSSNEDRSVDPLKQLKTSFLWHCRAPIKVASNEVPQLLIATINLAYGSPASREDLLSAENAKAALAAKVVDKTMAGTFI